MSAVSAYLTDVNVLLASSDAAALTFNQITDAFLVGLAVRAGGRLATFDRRISADAVQGGANALEVIAT